MSKRLILGDPDWTNAYGEVRIQDVPISITFTCVCTKTTMIIADDEEKTCADCGRKYWLGVYFRMNETGEQL